MAVILGIHDGHDSSAAVMVDGRIVAAAQEERFSGEKVDCGYPAKAIEACMKLAGVEASDLDEVAVATANYSPVLTALKRETRFSVDDYIIEQEQYWKPRIYEGKQPSYWDIFRNREDLVSETAYPTDDYMDYHLTEAQTKAIVAIRNRSIAGLLGVEENKVRVINHELCHVFYSYYASPMRGETLALTADGFGDHSNGTVSRMSEVRQEYLSTTNENNLARIYRYITLLLGMKPMHHEYKVMGLAPYANEYETAKSMKVFENIQKVVGYDVLLDQKPPDFYYHFRDALACHRFDGIAGALQDWTENILCEWLDNCIGQSGLPRVLFSGGVAQNIKACKAMADMDKVEDFYVAPASGDTSISIGACHYAMWQRLDAAGGNHGDIAPLDEIYLGPTFSREDTERSLREKGAQNQYDISENFGPDQLAKLLANGNILARCTGRMEFGMRALGNRSILADPRSPATVEKINRAIKFRDFWMPFTPSMLDRRADDYLVNPKGLKSPYMTMAFDSTPLGATDLAGAIHPADRTVRPQILARESNPGYYDLIEAFERETGVGALLNTSFNLHGHPIVLGPDEALFTLENSELDGVIIGEHLVMRRT
jgi:carbamoyltransferase